MREKGLVRLAPNVAFFLKLLSMFLLLSALPLYLMFLGVNFINVKHARFSYERHFGSFF